MDISKLGLSMERICDYRKTKEIFELKEITNLSLLESIDYLDSKVDERLRFFGYEEELCEIKKKLIHKRQESSSLENVDLFWFGYEISSKIHKIIADQEAEFWRKKQEKEARRERIIKEDKFHENLGGRNLRKKRMAEYVADNASMFWSQVEYKNYRVTEMAEDIFQKIFKPEVLDNLREAGFFKEDLPASVDAVKKIIRKVAPESAMKAGRPKK